MSTLDQYRQAKADYERLHSEAKKALIARAQEIAAEWCQIQKELRDDFGHKLTWNGKARLARKKAAVKIVPKPQDIAKIRRLEKSLAKAQFNVANAKDPKESQAFKDRVYELEDALKFAKGE